MVAACAALDAAPRPPGNHLTRKIARVTGKEIGLLASLARGGNIVKEMPVHMVNPVLDRVPAVRMQRVASYSSEAMRYAHHLVARAAFVGGCAQHEVVAALDTLDAALRAVDTRYF